MTPAEAELLRWTFFKRMVDSISPLCTWLKVGTFEVRLEKSGIGTSHSKQVESEYEIRLIIGGRNIGHFTILVTDKMATDIKLHLGTAAVMALGEILKIWSIYQEERTKKTLQAVKYIEEYFGAVKI